MTEGGILWRWDGHAMRPMHGHFSKASIKFKPGGIYRLDDVERSSQSHDHYFACLKSVWENLPEGLPYKWNNIDDMRRWALVQVGCVEEIVKISCSSADDAFKASLACSKAYRGLGRYCLPEIDKDNTVHLYVAKSQSLSAMSKKEFEDSKEKVLRLLGEIIGVSPEQLLEEGKQ